MPGTVQDVTEVKTQETMASIGVSETDRDAFEGNRQAETLYVVARSALQIRERGLAWVTPYDLVVTLKMETGGAQGRPRVFQYEVVGFAHETPGARKQRERMEMAESAKDNVTKREQVALENHRKTMADKDSRIAGLVYAVEKKNAEVETLHASNTVLRGQQKRAWRAATIALVAAGVETVVVVVDALSHVL